MYKWFNKYYIWN